MEWQKYAPWIIGIIVVLYVIRKATTKTSLLPQTQLTQIPQTDAYAEARSKAFESLAALGVTQTQSSVELARISEASALERLKIGSTEKVNLSMLDLQQRLANLNFLQRNQDIQAQNKAVDRYYSSRNPQSITGSISQVLGQIFGNRQGGNVFGTPPTFPTFGGF